MSNTEFLTPEQDKDKKIEELEMTVERYKNMLKSALERLVYLEHVQEENSKLKDAMHTIKYSIRSIRENVEDLMNFATEDDAQ